MVTKYDGMMLFTESLNARFFLLVELFMRTDEDSYRTLGNDGSSFLWLYLWITRVYGSSVMEKSGL